MKKKPAAEQPTFLSPFGGLDLKPHKSIRLAVSGDVSLNRLECEIIDSPDFQRLRGIRQLGTAYLVYPTALHTRFDHSLGTLAMSCEMMQAIRENRRNSDEERLILPEQEQLARLYALLHDIGHIPFGHELEDGFRIFPRHDRDPARLDRFVGRERPIGRMILQHLGSELYDRFVAIMNAEGGDRTLLGEDLFIYDLVSNTVCADLLDYLRRDSMFCGMTLDLDYRFLRYLYLHRDGRVRRAAVRVWKEEKPAPRRDVLSELIRLLDNRYLLGERVYFHHAKLVAGAMIAAAVGRAKVGGEIGLDELLGLGDETLLERLSRSKLPTVANLARAIRERRLWKIILRAGREEILSGKSARTGGKTMDGLMQKWGGDPEERMREEDRMALGLGLEPGDLLISCPGAHMAMKLADTIVLWNGRLIALRDCVEDPIVGPKLSLILKSHESLWALRAFLNPDALAKSESARAACEAMLG